MDDEADLREFVRAVAEPLGWTVAEAASGRELMDCYPSAAPDLILLDMVMPQMDGVEALRWLAARNCAARIVVMTGYSPIYTVAGSKLGEAMGINVVGNLQKPVPVVKLREILGAASD